MSRFRGYDCLMVYANATEHGYEYFTDSIALSAAFRTKVNEGFVVLSFMSPEEFYADYDKQKKGAPLTNAMELAQAHYGMPDRRTVG